MNAIDRLRLIGVLPLFPDSPDEPDNNPTPVPVDKPEPVTPLSTGARAQIPKTTDAPTHLVFSDKPLIICKPFSKKKDKNAPLTCRKYSSQKLNSRIGRSYYVFIINRTNLKENEKIMLKQNQETNQTKRTEVSI